MEFTISSCIFGHACIVIIDNQLCGVDIADTSEAAVLMAATRFGKINAPKKIIPFGGYPLHHQVIETINHGTNNRFDIHIISGTYMQRKVWKELQNLDSGQVISYKDLAYKIAQPWSFRAVANACGANPIAIIIPCHRAISSSGKLGGYRWGVDVKKKLLEREGVAY